MNNEKQGVALSSVIAAIFLTTIKVIVGIFTGSLGILSEAAHSALDLGAAVITYFAVKLSGKPADDKHTYGHGKIESFSALIETFLLFVTCGWIIYEAVHRIVASEGLEISNLYWGIGVIIVSIIVDISRATALKKAAIKYNSQALEADALHFSSDVLSSGVVVVGLILVKIGEWVGIPYLKYADSIAAMGVSILVIIVSIRLLKRTIEVLIDSAPDGIIDEITSEVTGIIGVLNVEKVRARSSGIGYFIEISVGISKNESHRVVHTIIDNIKSRLEQKFQNSDIVVTTIPIVIENCPENEEYHIVKKVIDKFTFFTNIHNINIYNTSNKKCVAIHLEVKEDLDLHILHDFSHQIKEMILNNLQEVEDVSVNFEYTNQSFIPAEDETEENKWIIEAITSLTNINPNELNCHDIKIYRVSNKFSVFLHCELQGQYKANDISKLSKDLSTKIKRHIPGISNIHIHFEPKDY